MRFAFNLLYVCVMLTYTLYFLFGSSGTRPPLEDQQITALFCGHPSPNMPLRPGEGWVSALLFRPFMQPDPPNLEVVVKFTAVHFGLPWVRCWQLVLTGGVGPLRFPSR